MTWIITGTVAFAILILFEIQKCINAINNKSGFNLWFGAGTLILLVSFGGAAAQSSMSTGARFTLGIILLILGVSFYILVLTNGLSRKNYFSDGDKVLVCKKGLYGRLRHPGVWSFLVCGLGFCLIFVGTIKTAVYFTMLNFVYTWLQDNYFFPLYLEGYDEYKGEVPYLIPKIKKKLYEKGG